MIKGAIISEDEQYRYQLWRIWDKDKPMVMFLMLNPSTADATEDDNTVRRCINFAKEWGYGGIYTGNLFAYRAKNPKDLLKAEEPVGEENLEHLESMSERCGEVICAWGNNDIVEKLQGKNSLEAIKKPMYAIEFSIDGNPKHPLYLRNGLTPKPYLFGLNI